MTTGAGAFLLAIKSYAISAHPAAVIALGFQGALYAHNIGHIAANFGSPSCNRQLQQPTYADLLAL